MMKRKSAAKPEALKAYREKRNFDRTAEPKGARFLKANTAVDGDVVGSRHVDAGRSLAEIARDEHGDVVKAAKGDPIISSIRPGARA